MLRVPSGGSPIETVGVVLLAISDHGGNNGNLEMTFACPAPLKTDLDRYAALRA